MGTFDQGYGKITASNKKYDKQNKYKYVKYDYFSRNY